MAHSGKMSEPQMRIAYSYPAVALRVLTKSLQCSCTVNVVPKSSDRLACMRASPCEVLCEAKCTAILGSTVLPSLKLQMSSHTLTLPRASNFSLMSSGCTLLPVLS